MSRLVLRVIEGKAPDQAFGAAEVTAEVNRRYGKHLGRPADLRTVAAKLRRLAAAGKLHEGRAGRTTRRCTAGCRRRNEAGSETSRRRP